MDTHKINLVSLAIAQALLSAVLCKPSSFLMEQGCLKLKRNAHVEIEQLYMRPESDIIDVDGSLRVQLSRNPLLYSGQDTYICKVGYKASRPDHRLLMSWEYFAVGEDMSGRDWLYILDLESNLDLSDAMYGTQDQSTEYRKAPPTTDYHSVGVGFTFAYKGHPYNDAVTVILTEFKNVDKNSKDCPRDYYKCEGMYDLCINKSLRCNNENNCGKSNLSDEDQSCHEVVTGTKKTNGPPVGLIGALVGIFATGAILALVLLLIYCIKGKRPHQWANSSGTNTSINNVSNLNSLTRLKCSKPLAAPNEYAQMPAVSYRQSSSGGGDQSQRLSNPQHENDDTNQVIGSTAHLLGSGAGPERNGPVGTPNGTHAVPPDGNLEGGSGFFPPGGSEGGPYANVPDQRNIGRPGGQYYYDLDEVYPLYQEIS